jgi:phage tail-like protein
MDANGARFMLVPLAGGGPGLAWDGAQRRLRLASVGGPALPQDRAAAEAAHARPRAALDTSGTFALIDPSRTKVLAGGAAPGLVEILTAPAGETILDLAVRSDGVLCVALAGGGLLLATPLVEELDPPFAPVVVTLAGFAAGRVAIGPDATVWVLGQDGGQLAQLSGQALPSLLPPQRGLGFRPEPRNPDPPRLLPVPLGLPAGLSAKALVSDQPGRVVLLLWDAPTAALMVVTGTDSRIASLGELFPFDIGVLAPGRLALLFAGWPVGRTAEAVAVTVPAEAAREPLAAAGEIYPLPGWDGAGFLNGAVARYLDHSGTDPRPRPLVALSRPAYAREGRLATARLDSRVEGFVWHRLYLEAALPPGTGLTVTLHVGGHPAPHRFGVTPGEAGPLGTWLPQRSELPFHEGLLGRSAPDRCGLFGCLVQAPDGPDRSLRGRTIEVEVTLHGNGRATPELAALRVWGPRFSYRDRYLPRLYRNPLAVSGDDGPARLDFLDRFLALFEGVLTPMEDEVASAFRLLAPDAAPADSLDWLGSLIDLTPATALPVGRQRRQLGRAVAMWRRRGTRAGLEQALDIVTGNLVRRGDIVVVEHFRLRRTMATILGARLEPEADPLLPGRLEGGNSVVGRTLILGADSQREFLALFRPEELDPEEEDAAQRFLDEQANQVTVLVHRELPAETLGLVRRTVEAETPAHVAARVLAASRPLLLGLTSLLEVDTYTRPRPPRAGVVLDATRLGAPAFLNDAPSADPRLEGGLA